MSDIGTDFYPFPAEAAPPAPAAPAPQIPGGVLADLNMTPAQAARAEIELLKADPAWAKRWYDGDPAAAQQLKALQLQEHQHSQGSIFVGGPTPEHQLNQQAMTLVEAGLPSDVIEHFRSGGTVSASEYAQATAMWNNCKADPEWRAKLARGDHHTKQQHLLMQIIRSSRISG